MSKQEIEKQTDKEITLTSAPLVKDFRKGKKLLHIGPKKGEVMDICATTHKKYTCCNIHVIKTVQNCPYECAYCFLQNYLTNGTTTAIGDIPAIIQEVKDKTKKQTNRLFRIGTWELGDSLALEKETGQAQALIKEFTKIPNAILELKTKSDVVDPILKCDHKYKTVVSWSMNPKKIINYAEHKTARYEKRLEAIQKTANAGYLIGLHFDPMILHDNWEENYTTMINDLFTVAPQEQIAWISIGSLRFNPEMKKQIELNYPKTLLTHPEMIKGDDGKVRYVKPTRIKMYQALYNIILKNDPKKECLTYLCMEQWDMYDRVFGNHPESTNHLDYLFHKSLFDRFPKIGLEKPNLENYLQIN